MPLAASGEISIGGSTSGRSINLEFGRTATQQTSMSQLYRGGGIVGSGAPNVPTSGAISLSQFYNAANRIAQTITLSTNQSDYVLNTAKVTGYQAGLMDVTLTINSGVYVSATSTAGRALDVDTSWAPGDTLTIVNNGFIVGRGGNGGNGGRPGGTGSAGGLAFRAQRAVSVNNAGTIGGGGGGGGGGGDIYAVDPEGPENNIAGGGGGGGGRSSTTNSTGGGGGAGSTGSNNGSAGGAGTTASAGGGGPGGSYSSSTAGPGGAGGGWGATGTAGTRAGTAYTNAFAGPGGSGGGAVSGNSNITWIATGTRLGSIT